MGDVVAVVEGEHVERRVEVVGREAVVRLRVARVDEDVLREVAEHQRERRHEERHAEEGDEGDGVVRVHRGEGDEVERRREHRAGGEAEAPLAQRVERQVDERVQHEVARVVHPLQRRRAVVRHGGGDVVREEVVRLVVHHAVLEVVRAARHPPEVAEDEHREVVEQRAERAPPAVEERAVRRVVHREDEALAEHDPRDRQVHDHPQRPARVVRHQEQLHARRERQPQRALHERQEERQVAALGEEPVADEALERAGQRDQRLLPPAEVVEQRELDRVVVPRLRRRQVLFLQRRRLRRVLRVVARDVRVEAVLRVLEEASCRSEPRHVAQFCCTKSGESLLRSTTTAIAGKSSRSRDRQQPE